MGARTQVVTPAGSMTVRDANLYLEEEQIDGLDDVADDDELDFDSRSEAAREAVDRFLEDLEGGTA